MFTPATELLRRTRKVGTTMISTALRRSSFNTSYTEPTAADPMRPRRSTQPPSDQRDQNAIRRKDFGVVNARKSTLATESGRLRQMRFAAVTAVAAAALLLTASVAWAQFGRGGNASISAHMARPDSFDGRFHYCRAVYRMNPGGDGGSWLTDYPLADIDLSVRLAELTKMRVGFDPGGQPQHLIVQLTADELFKCPVIIMQEVGRLFLNDEDATRLRTYLLKGGFLWVDDFWGSYAWDSWATQIRKVFPPRSTDRRSADGASDLPHDVRPSEGATDPGHRVLAWQRRRHVRARRRQRAGAHARDLRPHRTPDGAHDPQHGRQRFVGARRRRPTSTSTSSQSRATRSR